MTDTELSTFLPIHGDRLHLRQLLKSEHGDKKKKTLVISSGYLLNKAKSKSKREILEEK